MKRYVYETHIMKNLNLPFIFHVDSVGNLTNSIPNWHENIEILCFKEGEGNVRFGTEEKKVKQGDIAIINPEVLHVVTSETTVLYYCLIVDREFCEANGLDISGKVFQSVINGGELCERFDTLSSDFSVAIEKNAPFFAVAKVRCEVLGILVSLCRNFCCDSQENYLVSSSSSKMTRDVIKYLRENFCERISLEKIAERIGVSKYHMSREFKRMAGTTIFEYLNIIRCKEARRMLSEGALVSEAANATGYENLSYFSRSFKKYTGALPSAFIKKQLKSSAD